jgi:hypothetical protein
MGDATILMSRMSRGFTLEYVLSCVVTSLLFDVVYLSFLLSFFFSLAFVVRLFCSFLFSCVLF